VIYMDTRAVRRAAGDVSAVCHGASPVAATKWVAGLVTRLPDCARSGSLLPADRAWERTGACFRTPSSAIVSLPPGYTAGAREMYCRNVYLRTGLTMPADGWVIDLGANHGLFSVWAAVTGAQVVAVEAQQGFAPVIAELARHNRVADRVHLEIGMASGVTVSGAAVGVMADDSRWASASHSTPTRPADVSVPDLLRAYRIDRVGLLKVDIEGGEFALLSKDEDTGWLDQVDQLVLELHCDHGDPARLVERLRLHGFGVDLRDNDGKHAAVTSGHLAYAYCKR
jgi:FkbM family methyltransferase